MLAQIVEIALTIDGCLVISNRISVNWVTITRTITSTSL